MAAPPYFPTDFDPGAPLALICGRGDYPRLTAAALRERKLPVRLIAFDGETPDELWTSFPPEHRARLKVGQLGKLLRHLRQFEARYAVMVGQITPGRLFRGLTPDIKAVRLLASLPERNAHTIFGAIVREIEAIGVNLLDARVGLHEHLATPGSMNPRVRLRVDDTDIAFGVRIAREIARLDIGQGVVVRKGTVIAVEAFEGTDAMLQRAGQQRTEGLTFVKAAKPGQDFRFDVPAFGPRTVEVMRAAGIETACLEVGKTLLLDKPRVIEAATAARISLLGYPAQPGP